MPTVNELNAALELHQRGQLDQAARAYQRILADEPDNADALHLLGVLAHQQGDSRRAVELIGRAVAIQPSVAVFHSNLAEAYRALGQLDRAVGCCRMALIIQPTYAEAANNLGLALQAQGKLTEAAAQFQKALQLNPRYGLAANNLAIVCQLGGDRDKAEAHFRQAVAADPNLAEAHSNLGQLLMEKGSLDEAAVHLREAVRLRPDFAEAHNNLGNLLREQGQLTEAKACYAEAMRLNPDLAMACNNMGQALQEEGKFQDALVWYRQALEKEPNSFRIHANLASCYEEQENYADAVRHYEVALQIDPKRADVHSAFAGCLQEEARYDEALTHFREALRLQPEFPAAQVGLGHVLEELGELGEAEAAFRAALKLNPRHVGAHAQLATLLRGKLPEADLEAVRERLADPKLPEGQRPPLHFGLAHVLDARADYAAAAEHLRQGNAQALATLRKREMGYAPEEHAKFVENLIATFTPAYFERTRGFGLDTDRPVFIVGLPRSGTTLAEQILASHSKVFGAGERRFAREALESLPEVVGLQEPPLACVRQVSREAVQAVARRHLDKLVALAPRALRVVDKMPDNYTNLGLIVTMFPNVRLIHCRRDLRDIAVSCWMTNFRHIRWANDPEHIATRFREYRRLMEHWHRVLPVPMLEIDYEETVSDLEAVARRLVAWVGLEWEPACLAFHETKRPVRTASVTQVRQPVYQRSVARWKHYEADLGPLFAQLPAGAAANG